MGFDPQWAFRDCKWCGAHDVQMQQSGTFVTAGASHPGARSWTALSCPRCASLTIVERNADQLSPPELISVWPRDEDLQHEVNGLPEDTAEYFGNARKALTVGLPDSAAVELRRTLEAATAAYGADKGVLVRRVQKLIEDGHVTNVFEPALGYIRKIGNVAAHAGGERLTASEVQQALTFTTLLLRNLFELPAQVKALEEESPPPPIDDPAEGTQASPPAMT